MFINLEYEENYDEFNLDFQEPYQVNHNQQYATEIPRHATQITIDRYQSLANQDVDTKNIPKTFGNNFKKFLECLSKKLEEQKQKLPEKLQNFVQKKQAGKQSNYTLSDFKAFYVCEQSNKYFQFYMKHQAFLDLMYSNRIRNPEEHIQFIEQYLAGSRDPTNFISNRPVDSLKVNKKKEKELDIQARIIEGQQPENQIPAEQPQEEIYMSQNNDILIRRDSFEDAVFENE